MVLFTCIFMCSSCQVFVSVKCFLVNADCNVKRVVKHECRAGYHRLLFHCCILMLLFYFDLY